ncbi:MAG: endolytic transglycosylase MltG [Candidatus Komeilibacteria bacterium]|nr:endolytic transglycosylase MltG [Candidatus Komeilibacteria bacterium]
MFKIIKYLLILVMLVAVGGWVFYSYQISAPVGDSTAKVAFEVEQGEGVNQISSKLAKRGLIRSSFWFDVYVWQKNLERNFVAGVYDVPSDSSIRQLVKLLTSSGNSEQKITIIEGWNNKEIAAYLEKQGLVQAEYFLNLVGRDLGAYVSQYAFLTDKPASVDLEGYLFPDTYRVFKNSTAQEIIKKMLNNFSQKLTPDLLQEIKRRDKSLFEIITLASIIEKEVRNPDDMRLVADIFYKRLEAGIALQSDATVNYLTGSGRAQSTAEDLKIDSPYNTYKYRGLPPGPISNPGLNAIMAAIYPTPNQYYYFLTTDDGQVIYSKTYDEHLANKRKYLD